MPANQSNKKITERSLMAVIVILLLFLSPLSNLWASLDAPWYSPYLAWIVAILLSWLLQRHIARNTDHR